MPRAIIEIVALSMLGVCFWLLVSLMGDTPEPWDASLYWAVAYPISVLLAGAIGFRMGHRGWIAGAVLTLAQFPVMLVLTGAGPMSVLGLMIVCALAGPAAIVSAICGWIGLRMSQHR